MIYLIIFFVIVLGLFIFSAYKLTEVAMFPKTWKYEDTYNFEIENGRFRSDYLSSLQKEEFFIDSPYGYKLHAIYFPNKESKKTIIFSHGVTYSLYGSIKYMDMFYKRGFNVFIYDQRFHGRSEGDFCTYGNFEKFDLKACTDWVLNRNGADSIVGIHGESMGAATALQNAGIDSRVAFYIADCPYSDFFEELKIRIRKDFHLPPFPFLNLADIIFKIKSGTSFKTASPIKAIKNVTVPIFFVHGANDNYIPNTMSKEMFEIKKGIKKLYIAPNADHAQSVWRNPEEYDRLVGEFLEEIKII